MAFQSKPTFRSLGGDIGFSFWFYAVFNANLHTIHISRLLYRISCSFGQHTFPKERRLYLVSLDWQNVIKTNMIWLGFLSNWKHIINCVSIKVIFISSRYIREVINYSFQIDSVIFSALRFYPNQSQSFQNWIFFASIYDQTTDNYFS